MAKIIALSAGLGEGEYELGYQDGNKESTGRFFAKGDELPTLWAAFCFSKKISVDSIVSLQSL